MCLFETLLWRPGGMLAQNVLTEDPQICIHGVIASATQ